MKKTLIAIVSPFCRLVSAALWQLVWLVPVGGLCWYGKMAIPRVIRAQFNIDQAQDRLLSLDKFADAMKNSVSLTNPAALVHYISAQLTKFSISTKLNSMELVSGFLQTLCIWGLNAIWIVAVIYAIIRTFRHYRARTETNVVAQTVVARLTPQLIHLQQEITKLHEELQNLKQTSLPDEHHEEPSKKHG